jgi:uroporphyrinogen-III synthase
MKRKTQSPPNMPLKGISVLVGRARHQAGVLSAELRKRGAEVLEIPFIEIRKPRSFRPLDSALKNVNTYDWLILTSVNGVEAMWARIEKAMRRSTRTESTWPQSTGKSGPLEPALSKRSASKGPRSGGNSSRALTPESRGLRIAAIGPATRKAIEQRGVKVDVMPKEYVAESVVRSLKGKVKEKRVLLVRAKVARDVIPRELRKAGAHVDVVEAYETVVPESSRSRLQAALKNPKKRPNVVTFTSSSTVKNFVELLGTRRKSSLLEGVQTASIGPVTSTTLRELGLPVDIVAREFTIPGLVAAILRAMALVTH